MNAVRFAPAIRGLGLGLTASLTIWGATSYAQVPLADQPVFTAVNVPGNLALALSVEFPTAISVAHPNRGYSSASTYIGYFDPAKCYTYHYVSANSDDNYFEPNGLATNHTCSGKWSGNYLNWATMQTIDPFRWALTGGYRVKDTSTLTVLEKAWASNQGSTNNFPDSAIAGSAIASATPFNNTSMLGTRIWNLGNKINFMAPRPSGANGASFTASYFNNKTLSNTPVVTRAEGVINYSLAGTWFPSGVNRTNVSARWVGSVVAPTAGDYSFKIRGDDGVRLTVQINNGNSYTINNGTPNPWRDQAATDYTLSVPGVSANDSLNITVEYYQGGGLAEVSLKWQVPGAGSYANVGGGDYDLYGTATHYNPANPLQDGVLYEAFVRVKVCDASALEANCKLYGSNSYKPVGLMQNYADKIRYSAFGYLNDSALMRDGAVLRARQKFIGPTMPVPGGQPAANSLAEWDATTGVMNTNPDATDASDSNVANSGVMNYLNKFGQSTHSYKTYDPVSELYYAAQRYLRNVGNVTAWSNNADATMKDGFPVITSWDDPIRYSCQRNFILGIGDVNTHADRNLPGATTSTTTEPGMPTEVTNDTVMNAQDWTDKVGALQEISGLGSAQNYNGCCNNNGALMAGLAYWANVSDIRSDLPGKQTIQTYWLDVLEFQQYRANNQYLLAAKYGGFKPDGSFSAGTATASTFSTNQSWWATTTDLTPDGNQPRPDNYYTAARADQMVDGLSRAFSSIASQLSAFSTSFSTALPQVSALGSASYATKYDARTWTGELEANATTFDTATGQPSLQRKWTFSTLLAAQAAGTGWNGGRNIVTYNTDTNTGVPLRSASIAASQLSALDTSYVAGNDSASYLNYLRGDRSNEVSSNSSGSTHAYRDRTTLLGDIVNAKARPVGPPAAPYSDANNPGYADFKTRKASRPPMVYVGSNDGMLHAVNGNLTGADAGKEVWAYVPGALFNGPTGTPSVNGLASVGNPTFQHHFLVDASPVTADIDFSRTAGGSGSSNWRTILVGGLGKGGKSLYALDITDPRDITDAGAAAGAQEGVAAQKVLWEFTDGDLGYTYGQPIIVKTRQHGWVVIAASGYNNADGKGYIYIINPRTGARLDKVAIDCGACSASNQAGLAHLNAFVLDYSDGYADAIYGGDLMGNLWRLDVTAASGGYPAPLKFATLVGSDNHPLPITTKPLPVVQPGTNRRYITVGTGRMLDSTDMASSQAQRFFAIIDGSSAAFSRAADLPTGISFPLTISNLLLQTNLNVKISLDLRSQLGWYIDLGVSAGGSGWRVLTDPTSFYGTVAFAATSPSTNDACSPNGTSRVYNINLGDGYCALNNGGTGCYEATTGIVIDTSYYVMETPEGPKPVLLKSEDNCSNNCNATNPNPISPVDTTRPGAIIPTRMNWREILTN